MSTEIKNTLFRFVTMRAPELIENDEVAKSFVQHPEHNKLATDTFDSDFLAAVYAVPSGKTKKQHLKDTATAFETTALKSREEVKALVSSDLFEFAIWLTANRASFTHEEVIRKISCSGETLRQTPLSTNLALNRISLWDNLFYQIVNSKSAYVRDAILSVLVADFFLNRYQTLEQDAKALRKLAQARVLLPKELTTDETATNTNRLSPKELQQMLPSLTKDVKKEIENSIISDHLNLLNKMVEVASSVEKEFNNENQKSLEGYNESYENALKQAYAQATKVETSLVDETTGETKTITTYENLVLPEYAFEGLYFDAFLISKITDEDSKKHFKGYLDSGNVQNFSQLIELLQKDVEKLNKILFERTIVSQKTVVKNGLVIPVNNTAGRTTTPGFFTVNVFPFMTTKKLKFVFNGVEAGTEIEGGSYTITLSDDSVITGSFTGEDSMVNNYLTVNIPFSNENSALQDGPFSVEGSFISSTGRTLSFSGTGTIVIGGTIEKLAPNNEMLLSQEVGAIVSKTIKFGENYSLAGTGDYTYGERVVLGDDETNTTTSSLDYIPSGYGVKRLGIADYRKVEQEVCCYVPGEVSHIENVMAREYKEKASRYLKKSDVTTTNSSESESEKLTDTTTTNRFEMNQEISSVLSEQSSYGTHGDAHIGGDKNYLSFGADFANNTSQETSDHQAVTNAQEVTERAIERIVQKVKEERVVKIVEEYEENNKHGFDNRKGSQHISGVFSWVDKIMRNRIVNYGKRLMYEFMIPEPSSFHNKAIEGIDLVDETVLEKPVDPRTVNGSLALTDFNKVTEATYAYWAAMYNAEVESMPKEKINFSKEYFKKFTDQGSRSACRNGDSFNIEIPEGYYCDSFSLVSKYVREGNSNSVTFNVQVGNYVSQTLYDDRGVLNLNTITIAKTKNILPVSIIAEDIEPLAMNVTAHCTLDNDGKTKWQLETFNAIIAAYEEKLVEYNKQLSSIKTAQVEKAKINPGYYRQIENTVLRKNCIEYLITNNTLGQSMITGNGITDIHAKSDSLSLDTYAAKVKFFEQAFEWDLMSYFFYPFYWAEKTKWQQLYNINDIDDALFKAFLQSGMAKVILTVRPGFEEAVNWYMATGQVWNGGQVPTINDPLFVSIIEELRETTGTVEETWESRVPTSLTVIQAGSIGLNVQGLPCDDDCKDFKLFDSDGNQVFNADGTPVSTNPIQQQPEGTLLGNVTEDLQTVTDSIETIQADIEEIKATLEASAGN